MVRGVTSMLIIRQVRSMFVLVRLEFSVESVDALDSLFELVPSSKID